MIGASVVLYNSNFDEVVAVLNCTVDAMSSRDILYLIDNSEVENAEIKLMVGRYKNVKYVFNGENLGYGAAHNVAIKLSLEEGMLFHAVINPDVTFDKCVLRSLASLMLGEPSLAHVMPKIVYPDGATQYLCKRLPTPLDLFFRRFSPFSALNENMRKDYELRAYDYNLRMDDVPALSGCFMFLRLNILEEIGFFDEKIFMYMEDFDLTRRVLSVASNCYYPDVQVVHAYQKGSYTNKTLLKYHLKSAIYYFSKWGWFIDKGRKDIVKRFFRLNDQK